MSLLSIQRLFLHPQADRMEKKQENSIVRKKGPGKSSDVDPAPDLFILQNKDIFPTGCVELYGRLVGVGSGGVVSRRPRVYFHKISYSPFLCANEIQSSTTSSALAKPRVSGFTLTFLWEKELGRTRNARERLGTLSVVPLA